MRKAIMALPLLLSGCASMRAVNYVPQTLRVDDAAQFQIDREFCLHAPDAWKPQVASGDVAQAALDGGADALSYLPIYPQMPPIGALGGAGKALSNGYDLTGHSRRNIQRHCIQDMASRDRSALLARPED